MMGQGKKVRIQFLFFLVVFWILSIFSALYFDDGGILNGIRYALFQIFGVLVPGIALLIFLKQEKLSQIEMIIYSFVLGDGCSIVVYFCMVPFGLKSSMSVVYLVIMIISIGYITYAYKTKSKRIEIQNDKTGIIVCCIIGVFLLALELIMSCGLHSLPLRQTTSIYQDFLFGVGNTIECSKEYPIINFRAIFEKGYSYHYIYNIHLAVTKILLDIPAFHLTAFYSYMQVVIFLVGGSYLFFRNVLGECGKSIAFGMIMVLFTTGYEAACTVVQMGHMYMVPNNFDIAMAFAMILVAVIYQQTKCDKANLVYWLVSIISFVISFGSKAPVGVIAASICGVLGILYVIRERKTKVILTYAIPLAVLGLVLYVNVLSGNAENTVKLADDLEKKSTYALGNMPQVQEWIFGLLGNLPQWLVHMVLGFYYSVVSYYPMFIIFSVGIIGFFIYKKIGILDIAFFVAIVFAVVITMMYAHSGGSQVYFIMAIPPYVTAFGLRGIKIILLSQKQKLCKQILICLCCFCATIGILNSCFATLPEYCVDEFKYGVACIFGKEIDLESCTRWSTNIVYPGEYQGYVWLRNHTGERDVLLGDRCTLARDIYCEGVFSERYIYIPLEEDRDIIRACYQGKKEAIREVMEKQNVKYMIQTLRVTPDLNIPDSLGQLVFENNAIKIYKLQDRQRSTR